MPKKSAHKAKKESPSMKHGAQKQGQGQDHGKGKGSGNAGASGKKIPGLSMPAGNKAKNACLPKAVMLLLPFIAVGSYFLFMS